MDPEIQSILDKDSLESIFANIKFLDTQIEINKYSSTTTDKTMYKGLNHQLTDIVNGLNKIKLV